jgi:tRNA threonylcarbamoyladenosine biosynthesis protein TsaB
MKNKKILAIETSGKICSVSLCCFDIATNDKVANFDVMAEYNINVGNKHDKFCAELCNRIMKDNDISFSVLDAVAVSIGPGSFTGLRIGLAIAKGLCFSDINSSDNQLPLIAVPTLNALANNALLYISDNNINNKLLAIIPSHSNLVYYQLFDSNGNSLSEISFASIDAIAEQFADSDIYITTNY